ncbi:hypothetical protein GV715_00350 [Klebsiella pneumoniae]|uniref:hypothetical protein n=1 Tax=Klebsiella pneumoniae TaxID=573 RepID=UPI0013780371|nr:hypothetical protein [Klebsiella pneumoniae]NBG54358.1 hypothetical protein [Klebsiella pneumoniae]
MADVDSASVSGQAFNGSTCLMSPPRPVFLKPAPNGYFFSRINLLIHHEKKHSARMSTVVQRKWDTRLRFKSSIFILQAINLISQSLNFFPVTIYVPLLTFDNFCLGSLYFSRSL